MGSMLLAVPAMAGGTIGFDEVRDGLATNRILLIDVREAHEFRAGHVPGAVNMPLSALTPAAVPKPADKTVVVMCRSGNRSGKATAMLATAGRNDVLDYSGSMIEWTAKAGPIAAGN
jgi:rhodanese-related sulfurtransferase